MSVAESPLRDRVLFVTGASRSGTTWLARLLHAHPDIAGVGNESHLFDLGVNALFDNHERTAEWERFLTGYLDRPQLVDLVRDLCDGVLLRMRERTKPRAAYVLEKTPVVTSDPATEIARKLEVYPDAWFVHIIRDGRAVARSLPKMPWARGWLPGASAAAWRRWVSALRAALEPHPRTAEVRYEALREDPAREVARLLDRIGIRPYPAYLEEVRELSAIAYASRDPDPGAGRDRWRDELSEGDLRWIDAAAGELLRELGYVTGPVRTPGAGPVLAPEVARDPAAVARALLAALREGDASVVRALCASDVRLRICTPAGDAEANGEEGVATLSRFAEAVFARSYRDSEWAFAAGDPFSTALFTGVADGGARVDVSIAVLAAEGRVRAVGVVSAGGPGGREVGPLEL